MAAGDKYVDCVRPDISLEELLWAVTVKQANGAFGVRVYSHSVSNASLDPAVACDMTLEGIEAWLRKVIVLDANGFPAINLITGT